VANFQSTVPQGAINGQFTINANGDQVYFSRGNLQYNKTTQVWSFMEHQYDMVETQGQNVGENYANQNIISLFGWGTSGWPNGNVYYQPYNTENNGNEGLGYGYGPTDGASYTYNLTGTYANADWGVFNVISNGGGQAGLWRTLTREEWEYVLFTRSASTVNGTENARCTRAKVSNVHGLILFPDNYTHPIGVTQPVDINNLAYVSWDNEYNATDFELMENNGAVFLPAAGYRNGTLILYVNSLGFYCSTTQLNSAVAANLFFGNGWGWGVNASRCNGMSVRLVTPAEN
jgi:hypothetical protein